MKKGISKEVVKALNFLCSAGPLASTVVTTDQLNELMLGTGGQILGRGVLYNLETQNLSPDVFKITLQRAN